ncbi:LOW QUALITY PROTEIN: D(5)-like dopamine receptor [Stegastes partitus]|uniref:LOW QUALITY PROTEIN: D(5)-like dopamine receptor n=1 Tax=Stegastes partitus TaxID=144197 RepID=A0A9Y4KBF4_9TELE|nr:PREDICTED: LOW QUALITY PROTEIN: D(5)-like dopamine receptor [Stegastes partitus]
MDIFVSNRNRPWTHVSDKNGPAQSPKRGASQSAAHFLRGGAEFGARTGRTDGRTDGRCPVTHGDAPPAPGAAAGGHGGHRRVRTAAGVSLRALTGCVLCVLIVSTLLGNTLVCAAVIKFRHLRSKVTNSFVISLAVSDLFVAVLVMPWRAVSEVAGMWLFGRFCDTWVAFDIMCSTASILNLCIISMDRYWAISSPFRYERKMTRRFAFVMIAVAWTLSVLISFIPVQLNWHRADNSTARSPEDCTASLNRTYAISSSLISFYIPVLIMVGTYTRIFRIAQTQIRRISSLERAAGPRAQNRRHRASTHDESALKSSFKRETKVLKTLSIIMGVFVFCWLPFFVLNCVVPFCEPDRLGDAPCVSDTTFSIFVWFGWANSSLNPVIYAFNADFRKAFSTILGCSRYCSSSAVETVDFSNELVSYHHDTTLQRDAGPVPGPGAQRPVPPLHTGGEPDPNCDRVSVVSDGNLLLPAILQYEAEISLDLLPFSPSGTADCYGIPGQIQDM